jgi:hypothetical protein
VTRLAVSLSPLKETRRSARVPLEVSIEVDGNSGNLPFKAATVIVNLHGALIRTVRPLDVGSLIYVRVLGGDECSAKVVHSVSSSLLTYGIELVEAKNIWGIELPPLDWETQPTVGKA